MAGLPALWGPFPLWSLLAFMYPSREKKGYGPPHYYDPLPTKGEWKPEREELTLGMELINSRCVQVLINESPADSSFSKPLPRWLGGIGDTYLGAEQCQGGGHPRVRLGLS